MAQFFAGAGVMLFGVMVGYAISNASKKAEKD